MKFIFTILFLTAIALNAQAETTSNSTASSNSDHGVERGSQVNFNIYESTINSSLKVRLLELLEAQCDLRGVISIHLENFEIRELSSSESEFKQVFIFTLSIHRDPAFPGLVKETVEIELGRKDSSDSYIDIQDSEPNESDTCK